MNTIHNVLLSTEGFSLQADLAKRAAEKVAKVLRHEHPCVDLVRAHVKYEARHGVAARFAVRITAERAGPDVVVHATGTEPGTAINIAVDKLERSLSAAARMRKHARHGTLAPAVGT